MLYLDLKQIHILKFKTPSSSRNSIFCATFVVNKEPSQLENKNLQKALEEQGVLPIKFASLL